MSFVTWGDLVDYHCSTREVHVGTTRAKNPFYEPFSTRRFNYSSSTDSSACRLIFSKEVLRNATNKTLCRKGRFLWCRNLSYEGKASTGLRRISFTVDGGMKRFTVQENNVLCVPSKVFVNNNKYFRTKDKTFVPFSTVFSYSNALRIMANGSALSPDELMSEVTKDNPFKPGCLVSPRLGYFYPDTGGGPLPRNLEHPCGIVLGRAFLNNDVLGRELYRVRFGETTYERIHPIQLEVINEV